jgi:plasmid stability protein
MARKKTEGKPMPTTATEPGTKPVRVELTDDLHRMLRKLAADDGVSMAAFTRDHLERFVREEFKRRGLK